MSIRDAGPFERREVEAPPWDRGLRPLRQAGAAQRLRRAGVVVEMLKPEEYSTCRQRYAGKVHQWWAPRWASALLSAEPISDEPRWCAMRRAARDEDFANALLTIIDAHARPGTVGERNEGAGLPLRALASFVQDMPDSEWVGYREGET